MAWKLSWSTGAASFMSKLDQAEARRISDKLESTLENPLRFFKRLAGEEDYKLRIGDYRALALLLHGEQTVFIEKVDHRKRVYKSI
ncbi:MAG TPA: type II toxin-antitoxin system RelE/ParE family toxin [Candidatus Micrarchaeota archaeon]|nr:type II toxin-antitoxin system RelE/ParE family toxin [Candidatus Micrarchaeota archaeon]